MGALLAPSASPEQVKAIVAALDGRFYDRAAVDLKVAGLKAGTDAVAASLSGLRGDADAAHDTLGEVAVLIDTALAAVALRALKDSPEFTGTPLAPTAPLGTSTTQIATMAALAAGLFDLRNFIVNGSGAALDQFNELATAIGNDPNFATTILDALGLRLRFDAAQPLTSAQVVQALTNIGVTLSSIRTFLTATSLTSARSALGVPAAASGVHTGTADMASVAADALSVAGRAVYGPLFVTGQVPADTVIGTSDTILVSVAFTAVSPRAFVHGYGSASTGTQGVVDLTWYSSIWDVTAGGYVLSAAYISTSGSSALGAGHASPSGVVNNLTVGRSYQLRLRCFKNTATDVKSRIAGISMING